MSCRGSLIQIGLGVQTTEAPLIYALKLSWAAVSIRGSLLALVGVHTQARCSLHCWAEFFAAFSMVQRVFYARHLLEKLGFQQTDPTPVSRIMPRASSGRMTLLGAQTERSTFISVSISCMLRKLCRKATRSCSCGQWVVLLMWQASSSSR